MNLADAIRLAAADPVQTVSEKPAAPAYAVHEMPATEKSPEAEVMADGAPEPPHVTSGNVVRLEMFLSNEQMSTMLKALMVGQHSILTLREAATFLRVSPNHLLELAESGEVPGLLLDGRWRFPRQTLEEWIYQEGMKHENRLESSDVA
jgi:excisionase family DNA binding protein